MSIEPHIREWVGEKNVHAFSSWAFGEDYEKLNGKTLVSEWNARHGKIYYIKIFSDQNDILKRMHSLWVSSLNDSKRVEEHER